ncbi:MAG: suppressor of fused domain protein, partial [Acidobacteriota bacterium]
MSGELELTVLQAPREDAGYVASFAITDRLILTAGGTSYRAPTVLASSNARHFEPRTTPRRLGLRALLAVGDGVWTCGEHGQLALSRDHGATWKLFETGTDACLFGLALAPDGAVWVVGGSGYTARVLGDRPERVELGTTTRLAAAYAVRDELIVLGGDGLVRRWRDGDVATVATGAKQPLTAFAQTRHGTWLVVGDGGFIARSPDGAWFSRATSGVEVDLEAIDVLADGRVVIVGDRGLVLVSSDDGRTWHAHDTATTAHLWSVRRFGGGALIGGDHGLVLKLAPPGDATWADRIDVFGSTRPRDAVFVTGPQGFVARGLAELVDEPEQTARPGEAEAFERDYGAPVPPEVARLRALARGRDCFAELTLADALAPAGDGNLFEQLVCRDQQAPLATGLVEAFCGVFCLGAQRNGDSYHVELYEWDGARQVLHFDHATRAFTGVLADSVDSLVYLAALVRAHRDRQVSDDAFAIALRKLTGKVAPTWHFALGDRELAHLDPKRRDTEFFFYRSRWICALLRGGDVADIPRLFMADFNQVVPQDQLPARYEACEKFIPTALYSMWRAYLFEEPELAGYLEICRRHRARLVRDAAALVDELRAGRDELGAIRSMRDHLAAFRALDLDPRRAEQRRIEADARARQQAIRTGDVLAELERTPRAGWSELAWRWLDDGVAHRALLARLEREPDLAAQLAALDELRELSDGEREQVLPALAERLAPELEAVLVGCLVRDDALEGVLARPDDDRGEVDDDAPGWDAIDRALAAVYGDASPHAHHGTALPYSLGGNDPLHGISVYLREEPVPHFHFVTYGFTDLFRKETDDPDESGFGFELTLRLRRDVDDTEVPAWPLNFLQNLGRYVFGTGNRFAAGHKMGLNGPIAVELDTRITAILFADDPELGEIDSPHGRARFVQVVGITDDEYRLIQEWSTGGLVEILRRRLPVLVTDLDRASVLDDPQLAREVRAHVEAEGSSEDLTFAGELGL